MILKQKIDISVTNSINFSSSNKRKSGTGFLTPINVTTSHVKGNSRSLRNSIESFDTHTIPNPPRQITYGRFS